MKYLYALLVFVCVHASPVNGQDTPVDSLRNLLRRTDNDTTIIGLYIEMSFSAEDSSAVLYIDTAMKAINALMPEAGGKVKTELYRYMANANYARSLYFANAESYDSALFYLGHALVQARSINDRLQEARVMNDMGVCYFRKNDVVKSIDLLRKSLAIREQFTDEEQLRNAYNNTAFIYKETGLIDQSLELNFKALALSEKRNSDEDIALSFNNIGQLYHKYLNDHTRAMEYYKKGLAILEKTGAKKGMSLLKNNIGALYAEMGNYPEAIRWYLESLKLRREISYRFGIINTLSSLGNNYIKIGDYARARTALGEAMELSTVMHDQVLETSIHRNYAELYRSVGKLDSALFHAKISHNINLGFGNPLNISTTAILLSDLYEKTGNYPEALSFYKLHKKMQDSISNDDLRKQGLKSDIEYGYLKKTIESDKIHGEQLARKNLYSVLLIVLFVISIILGYGIYKRYRLKQKIKEVEMRNKIAADLHDDVGSTLSSIRMYSDFVRENPAQLSASIHLLDKISRNSKETIETMSDIVWMIKPGNDEISTIENRMLAFAHELCAPAGISFEFSKSEMLTTVKIPMEMRRDIYLVFKEAINNAVKYADCKSIRAHIDFNKSSIQIHITDDGKGFNSELIKKGDGLSNMQKRAAAHAGRCSITSVIGGGTEVDVQFNL